MATGASVTLVTAIEPIWLLKIWPLEIYGYLRIEPKNSKLACFLKLIVDHGGEFAC
jgi:hypothetical protein